MIRYAFVIPEAQNATFILHVSVPSFLLQLFRDVCRYGCLRFFAGLCCGVFLVAGYDIQRRRAYRSGLVT